MENSVVKFVLQRCDSAQLDAPTDDLSPVSIGKGILVYVCFTGVCDTDRLQFIAEKLCNLKILKSDAGEKSCKCLMNSSDFELLLIPQFCLIGKYKKDAFQYHSAVEKSAAKSLFEGLVELTKCLLGSTRVKSGYYGHVQLLSTKTSGPFTHVLEL